MTDTERLDYLEALLGTLRTVRLSCAEVAGGSYEAVFVLQADPFSDVAAPTLRELLDAAALETK